MSFAKQPLEYKVGRLNGRAMPLRYPHLNKRYEAPVSTSPFLIRMDFEATVRLLTVKQYADPWSPRYESPSFLNFW